jgi:large repetitive protein
MFYLKSSRRRQRAMAAALVVTAMAILTVFLTQSKLPTTKGNLNHDVQLNAGNVDQMHTSTEAIKTAKSLTTSTNALPPDLQSVVDKRFGIQPGIITPTATGATIDNPTHQISATVDNRGLRIGDATVAVQKWGREDRDLIPVQSGTVSTTAHQVIIQRTDVHEIITTSAQGVRHDVVVEKRPAGLGELVVEIGSVGGYFERKNIDGAELIINGRRMTYDRLKVSDADGKELMARMEVIAGAVRVYVQDAGARYPLLVDPTISATGSMAAGRRYHTATLLPSGNVLIAGGQGSGGFYLASCELYDPLTGVWVATGALPTARIAHTAILLPSGKVLMAGGMNNNGGTQASCQLYDPGTGTWTATGSMALPRQYHAATLLPSGKVLVSGGYCNGKIGDPLELAGELYDPSTGTWTTTGSLTNPRSFHVTTLIPSGKVLVIGGFQPVSGMSSDFLASCELYDPGSGAWTATGAMATARWMNTATLLPSGKVLVAGGNTNNTGSPSSCELYDPSLGTWTATGSLSEARAGHTATLLSSGQVLVAGGSNPGGTLVSAELFDSATGTWEITTSMITARYAQTATLLFSGMVLATGGYIDSSNTFLASCELYGPDTAVAFVTPTAGSSWTTTLNSIPIAGTAFHPLGILAVTYQLSGATSGAGTATGTTAWNFTPTLNLGTTTITVTAEASDGSLATDTLIVTVTSPPTIAISLPTTTDSWLSIGGGLAISGTSSGSATVTGVTYALSGATSGSGSATGTNRWSFSPTLNSGITNVTVTATDSNGFTGVDSITITRDSSDPTIAISSPLSGGTYLTGIEQIMVSGFASDDYAISSITYELSGATVASGSATGTNNWSIMLSSLDIGTSILTVTAHDMVSRTAQVTLEIVYSADAPTISIVTPTSEASWLSIGGEVTIAGTASSTGALNTVTYSFSGATTGSGSVNGTNNWTFSPTIQPGITTVTVTAQDVNGKIGQDTITITRDLDAPLISLTAPTNGTSYLTETSQLLISGLASDDGGLMNITWQLSGATVDSGSATGTSDWSLTVPPLNHGISTITCAAHDVAGRTSAVSMDIIYPSISEVGTSSSSSRSCGIGSGLASLLLLAFLSLLRFRPFVVSRP